MEQHNSKSRENTESPSISGDTQSTGPLHDVTPQQQQSLPEGGDPSSPEAVGGSKPDPISTGPNVEDTIAGRN